MPLISERDQETLRAEFQKLQAPVRLVMFTLEMECQYCRETRQIVEELAALSDKIRAEVYDFAADQEPRETYGIDKIPAIAILRDGDKPQDYGIRYYGIPSGYEFGSLVDDILMVSSGESGLSSETKQALAGLRGPIHIQVFVTPTCPYCPMAVRLAHQMALESDRIRSDMVEAIEFPHLANQYQVMGVPRIVINEVHHIEGAVPERVLVEQVLQADRDQK